MEYKQHPYFTHEQVKETVKSNYLEEIKGKMMEKFFFIY